MRLMEGEHVGPFNLGNPGEFTMLELAKVKILLEWKTKSLIIILIALINPIAMFIQLS